MKYTEVPTDELLLQVEAGAAMLLTPGNAVNLTHMRELIIELERRAQSMHVTLQEIKAETTKPLEERKKRLEVASEIGRKALVEDIKRNGETVPGIKLVIGSPTPELPLEGTAEYKRLLIFLKEMVPDAIKVTIDRRRFSSWIAGNPTELHELAALGLDIIEPAHVRFS